MSKSVYAAVPAWRPQKRAFLRTGPPPDACSSLKTAIFKDGATSMGGAGPIGRDAGGQARFPWMKINAS